MESEGSAEKLAQGRFITKLILMKIDSKTEESFK